MMILLIALALGSSASAFSWSRISQKPTDILSDFTGAGDDRYSINQEELDSIFLNPTSLESFTHKPDCFRRAAGYMRAKCTDLEMDEDQRVRVAISMTLCELATARHNSPPMECLPFAQHALDTPSGPRDCVEALSRSAQFWSSYSGYLRETTQLCFAFQRWNDLDTAKSIYQNVTLEKVALLHLIIDREKRSNENTHNLELFLEVMRDVVTSLRVTMGDINTSAAENAVIVREHLQKTTEEFTDLVAETHKTNLNDHSEAILQIRSSIDRIFMLHETSLESAAASFGAALLHRLDDAFLTVRERNQEDIIHLTDQIKNEWALVSAEVVAIHESMMQVSDEAVRVASLLQVQSELSLATQQTQLQAIQSAEHLVFIVKQLTATTRSELQNINDTAITLRQNLIASNGLNYWLSTESLFKVVTSILKVDFSRFSYLFHYRIFHVIVLLVRLFGSIAHVVLSAMMSTIFFSSRKWFLRNRDSPRNDTSSKQASLLHSSSNSQAPHNMRNRRTSRIPDRLLRPSIDYGT